MLINDFYTIEKEVRGPGNGKDPDPVRFTLRLNPGHPVYGGHFPGQPVVPGVCQVLIVTECLGRMLGVECTMVRAAHIKYIGMIDPRQSPMLDLDLSVKMPEPGAWEATAALSDEGRTLMKLKATFEQVKTV